jgi:hypothetical protein
MANTTNQPGIVNSWSLLAFARLKGRMQVGAFTNKDTGESFHSCIFTNAEGTRTFCAFSSNLGEMSPAEIAANKDSLQVVELATGTYKLCRQGENSWEDVML